MANKHALLSVAHLTKQATAPSSNVRAADKQALPARPDGGGPPPPAKKGQPCDAPPQLASKDKAYMRDYAGLAAELRNMKLSPAEQSHGDARWRLICDASPRGLMPRAHEPWAHTGSVTFATWWEILQYDGLVYMLRGLRGLRELTVLRNIMAVLRIACRGLSNLGRPAFIPADLRDRAIRACIAFEDLTPVVAHRHSAHMPIHLV